MSRYLVADDSVKGKALIVGGYGQGARSERARNRKEASCRMVNEESVSVFACEHVECCCNM